MPNKMWKQCKVPGCKGLTKQKYCDKHQHLEIKDKQGQNKFYNKNVRDKKSQKFYESTAWRRVRTIYIKRNPLCEICYANSKLTKAAIVDHKTEIKDGGEMLDFNNLQSLCLACHNKKTAKSRQNRQGENDDK